MIKILKKQNQIFTNFEEKEILEDGTVKWNIPQVIDDLKAMAIDTINWQIGDSVKKEVGNTNVNLSASNAKAIALLAKVVNAQSPDVSSLTELEKDSLDKLINLADGGYADSKLLNASLTNVSEFIASGTDKITRITKATTHDEIIAILNEV